MPLTTATLTGKFNDYSDVPYTDVRRTKVWAEPNTQFIQDPSGDKVHVGNIQALVDKTTGAWSLPVIVGVENLQYRLHVEYEPRKPGPRQKVTFGWFTVPVAGASFADLVQEQYVPPTSVNIVTDLLNTVGLDSTNLIPNPSGETTDAWWASRAGINLTRQAPSSAILNGPGVKPVGATLFRAAVTGSGATTSVGNNIGATPITAGQWAGISGRVWVEAGRNVRLRVLFYGPAGQLGGAYSDFIGENSSTTGYDVSIPATQAPVGATSVRYLWYAYEGQDSAVVPTTPFNFYFDAALLVIAQTQAEASEQIGGGYFDGDTPATVDYRYRWTGPRWGSPSQRILKNLNARYYTRAQVDAAVASVSPGGSGFDDTAAQADFEGALA